MAGIRPTAWGTLTARNITSATVIKPAAGVPIIAQVIVAGTTTGAVYDAAATTGDVAANQVAVIPETVGAYRIETPCQTGILIVPGTGMTVAVSYD
ncbi:hypothetical protein [Acidiphilium sp.]|uniref:hypothetical protein n=1 Tax=Acidiphilium sp. TaxID=527 RepID=UPI003D035FA9